MICASELREIKKQVELDRQQAKLKWDNEARAAFKRATERTITFCNTDLTEYFTKQAEMGYSLVYRHLISKETDRLGNTIFHFVKEENIHYANGTVSKCATPECYAWDTLVDYLTNNGFTIDVEAKSFMCYGAGSKEGFEIEIKA